MQTRKFDSSFILNVTIVLEAILLLCATGISFVNQISLADAMVFRRDAALRGLGGGLLIASSGLLSLGLTKVFKSNTWFAKLKELVDQEIKPLFASLHPFDILLIACSSGFCEEVFFRGVLQTQLGIIPASIIFGLLHCASFEMLPYAFWTFLCGLLLGWLYLKTGSLWAPIIAHAVSNLIVLCFFRYRK